MAEWFLLIFIFAVIAVTFLVTRFIYGVVQTAAAWIIAGVILSIGLGVYFFNKVEETGAKIEDYYRQGEDRGPRPGPSQ